MTAEPTTTTTSMDHPKNEKKETKAATQHPRPANPVLAAASRITRAAFQQGTRVTSGVATATERTVTTAFHVVADGVETTVSTAVHTVADGVTFVGQTAAATVGLKSPAAAGSEAPPPSDDAPRQKSTPAEAITTDHDDVSTIPAATADKDAHHYFTMGPMLEFLTADATLLFVFVFSVALYPTWNHWDSLWEVRKVVTPVLWPWLLTAFCGGLAIGQQSDSHRWFLSWTPQAEPRQTAAAVAAGESVDQRERFVQDEKRNKHSLFLGVLGNQSSSVKFESGVSKSFRQPLTEEEVKFWSILSVKKSSSSHRSFRVPSWQLNMDPCQDQQYKDLVRMLLGHENVRRSRPNVGSLEGVVIEPLFQLRGVDVFLSDDPEPEPSTHPWLVQQGLRDRPTFTLNILTQWGNILIYFEMPAWVRNFHTPEDENDADDVKALKRFLNGNTEYRNARLKMMPCVVDGPMPIRMIAPPKKEKVVHCDWLPIIWKQHEEDTINGRTMCAHLEATLDCMTNRAIRSMASLVKTYVKQLFIDLAIVIGDPDKRVVAEPSACLGLWRFDHIDVSLCPGWPDRFEAEAKLLGQPRDVIRASVALGLSSAELETLLAEAE